MRTDTALLMTTDGAGVVMTDGDLMTDKGLKTGGAEVMMNDGALMTDAAAEMMTDVALMTAGAVLGPCCFPPHPSGCCLQQS